MAGVTLNSINNVASREEINTTPSNDLLKLLDDKIEELNDQIIQKAIKIKILEVYYENQKSKCKACRTFKGFGGFCAKENGRRLGRYAQR